MLGVGGVVPGHASPVLMIEERHLRECSSENSVHVIEVFGSVIKCSNMDNPAYSLTPVSLTVIAHLDDPRGNTGGNSSHTFLHL